MQWLVDGTVHLSQICTAARWRWNACIAGLRAAGLTANDAAVFAGFAFGTDARYQAAVSDESLSDAEYARLSVAASPGGTHPVPPPG